MADEVKFLNTDQDNINLVRNSDSYLATIETRIKFTYELVKESASIYHIPPERTSSSIRHILISIALTKESNFTKEFNKLYNE